MSFLKSMPLVYVVLDEYEILVITEKNGLIYLEIDGKIYHEKNSGILHTERNVEKFRIRQGVLNKARRYTVCFRESVDRKEYFSVLGDVQKMTFSFRPLTKTENIKFLHIADIHGDYEGAKKCASFFKKPDFIVINGDVTETSSLEKYYESCAFMGEISQGNTPILFARGNHDTRGKMAEYSEVFYPEVDGKFYYPFKLGRLFGVVLDCGEDKPDSHEAYGGTNDFETYRREEYNFLKGLTLPRDGWVFAISHICPVAPTWTPGDVFDIERELYAGWNKELERLKIQFMLSAHIHEFAVHNSGDGTSTLEHAYPVFVASDCTHESGLAGAAVKIDKDVMTVMYMNGNEIFSEYMLKKDSRKALKAVYILTRPGKNKGKLS